MSDFSTKVHPALGGDTLVVEGGGAIQVKTGGKLLPNSGTQASALTPPAATAATNSSPYGFSQAQADAIVTWIRAADAALKALGATA
ncbi:hypothetical protein [Mesorhizobium sp. B2-5-7]|uniref:hypothetical protein n=1 Tax=Mesorhizobium sp. B2-5-7 TaxID=2589923 RepID=UPI00112771A2|nr:hypothetical protein [Mesorhizobium sp. B2-5-7]TPK18068.1 hypothetical protein FJ543_06165 [Mesorhizobium sp. B2-5-7]